MSNLHYPENYTQEQLNIFYGSSYLERDTSLDNYELSGYNLPQMFNAGDRVIHVNCGSNPFNEMVPNLRGVDPSDTRANYVMSIEEYANVHRANKFHNAIVLGGLDNVMPGKMDHMVSVIASLMVKRDARIFWRTSVTGTYPWTFDEHARLAESINYHVVGMVMETETDIYAEWKSNISSDIYAGA